VSLTSSNGWIASENQDEIDIKVFTVIGGAKPVKLRCASAVAPLLLAACRQWNERVEKLEPGQVQGYAFRDVRGGAGTLSNHASGTAVDIFPARHPQGSADGNLTKDQQLAILDICKKYGLRSGGSYKNAKPDWMHIEINITPSEAAKLVASLKGK
jgi:hypothetical protein